MGLVPDYSVAKTFLISYARGFKEDIYKSIDWIIDFSGLKEFIEQLELIPQEW